MKSFLKKFFKKKEKPLKENLEVTQKGELLFFSGNISKKNHHVSQLWFVPRTKGIDEGFVVAENNKKLNHFFFEVNLKDLLQELLKFEDEIFDLYIKIELLDDGIKNNQEKFARFGRFENTKIGNLEYVHFGENFGICNITIKGNVSVFLNKEPNNPVIQQVDLLKSKSNSLELVGKVFTRGNKIVNGSIIAKGRQTNKQFIFPMEFTWNEAETEKKFGLNRYQYRANLDFKQICSNDHFLTEDVYDLYLNLKLSYVSEEILVRIGRPTFRAKHFLKEFYSRFDNKAFIITPYYTFKKLNLSLEVFEFDENTLNYLLKKLKFAWFYRLLYKRKDIWLVGERPYKAQDTGYHFFKYMRENHPDRNVYYVIEKDSPELRNVEPLGNILYYKSKKHILYSLVATRIVGSHHPDYLYPVRTERFKKAVKGLKVFLQHGIMGTKNMVLNYGKTALSFYTDAFLVSSDFEKNMIVKDFGYSPNEVYVTGLSRFDSLLANDVETKRQLLIIPTWRDWLQTEGAFLKSEYFERYRDLINSPILHSLAKNNNFEIVFCLHPNMQSFTKYFQDAPVKVISQGEVDVQHLLKESAIMITDYSSVGFDFSFLYKPIIYYQFDRAKFIGENPSHLDLEFDLPGDIVNDLNTLFDRLQYYAENDFVMKDDYKTRANKFIKYRDRNASERIYNVVKNLKKKRHIRSAFMTDMMETIYNRARKSKYYTPAMKLYYKLCKLLPIDKKVILFESGLGKQYGDSPRYIYEEIVNRNLNYKKIWVINNNININFPDANTKKIKRLSLQYYYYLARAGYRVNNQNFPTYIDKRKGITYIQTWHGTPLKKMLFDIENVQGRGEGYLERVHNATKTWDYLISPSDYATKAFKSAFRYNGEILEIGYPRNDIFYKEDIDIIARKVKRELNIPEDKKVILYAPTFRDNENNGKNKFVFNLKMDLHELKEQLGEEYILLLRMHVVISNNLKIPEELRDFAYNVSKYPDIQELCLISDILMTDYSSIMFDFANTKKPMLFFTYDLEEYKNDIRGFYMDFEQEAPGPFLFTTYDIIDAVKNIENVKEKYQEKYSNFTGKFCSLEDGNAAKRVVDRFFK